MTNTALDFYSLLPSLYRMRDEERQGPLRALLEILQEQADHIRLNIDDLYDDFFIETCAEWVVPYIGDLVANNPLYEVTSTRRADVARTLQYRHGKGTQRVLEQLARDVTGWSAHVVPFFELLEWTQHLNHLRLTPAKPNPRVVPRRGAQSFERVATVEIRNHEVLDRFDGPFDTIAHTVDVRPPQQASGWHNVHNTGFFLWRLFAYRLPLIQARPLTNAAGEHRFHLSPAGNPIALFHAPAGVREHTLTREADVEAPIRPAAFFTNTEAYYGAGTSLFLNKDGSAVPASAICTMDLSNWTRPEAGSVAVDVQRGRITFAVDEEPAQGVVATYTYGFSGNLGGGPYDRLATIVDDAVHIHVPGDEATLADAIAEALSTNPVRAVVTVDDSRTYDESLTIPIGQTALTIQARSTQRPTIHGDITLTGGNGRNGLTLNGLLLSGGLRLEGVLNQLRILHSTLIPGRRLDENGAPTESHLPSVFVAPSNSELSVSIERSITGAIVAPSEMLGITVKESIIDSASGELGLAAMAAAIAGDDTGSLAGPPLVLDEVTILGAVHVRQLEASNCIFDEAVTVQRRQTGCVRFSYVAPHSSTPRRFRCQPETAAIEPAFTSRRYGDAAYAQLSLACANEIRTGADDGSEMGAFHFLMQPQRETNLRVRLSEYLPFGLDAALIFVT
jgi:hypothetical protein